MKKLYKIDDEGMICGVCAGISDITGIDVTVLRVITFVLCWLYGSGLLIYGLFALLMPDKSDLK